MIDFRHKKTKLKALYCGGKEMHKFAYLFSSVLGVVLLNGCAGVAHAQDDKISQLIQRVEYQKKNDTKNLDQLEDKMLGRASWSIECRYQVFDDVKACMMQKGAITVMHLNNSYVVSVGERVQVDSQVAIYVDKNSIQKADDGLFRDASRLIDQFKKGTYAFIRYQSEGNSRNTEAKISLLGFTDAFNDMEKRFKQLNSTSSSSRKF